jgi:fermentation-respiration switch protein FrsA (DUF1100 family)
MLKFIYWAIGILSVIYLIIVCTLYFAQESLLFQDEKLEQNYSFNFQSKFEEINLKTADGALLNGLHFKAENPKGIIVYFHGNAGDLSRWGLIAEQYLQFNQDVLIVDYRGYGKSRGKRSAKKMYSDANLVYDYAKGKFLENQISVYGRSLGCTFATYASANNSPKQLILETPFYSLQSIVSGRYPIFPNIGLLKYKFPTYEFINQVKCPITFFHGTDDFVVPYENGEKLFENSPNANLITIPSGGHNDLGEYPKYWNEIKKILH